MTRQDQAIARSELMILLVPSKRPQWAEPSRQTLRNTDPKRGLLALLWAWL